MEHDYSIYARTYDLEYGLTKRDIPFYVDLAKRAGGPVLELAVGTGRVAMKIAREGIAVHGLDVTRAMLEVARAKLAAEPDLPVTLHEADMRTFDLAEHGPFRLISVPARAFLHMLTIEDQLAALARIRAHLADDGVFAGSVFVPSHPILARNSAGGLSWRAIHDYVDPESGNRVDVYELARADTARQRIEVRVRCEEVGPGGELVRTHFRDLTLTWIHPRELEHLLWRAGFELEALYGDFEGTPLSEGGAEMVWVARPR